MNSDEKFKAIFFDMDGLLVDTEGLYFDSVKEILATVGVEISKEWYIRENLGKGTSSMSLAKEKGLSDEEVDVLRERRDRRYQEMLGNGIKPIDGVVEVLEQLHGKLSLGLVTSSGRESFDVIMEQTGLLGYFDFFITGDDVVNIKPDPEPYLKAVEVSKQEKSRCLALEDSYKGSVAAKAAGITCYAIPDELTRTHDFSHVDKVLNSIREVPALVL